MSNGRAGITLQNVVPFRMLGHIYERAILDLKQRVSKRNIHVSK